MEIAHLLKEFGFPIFVCCWFMFRSDKRHDKIADKLSRLVSLMTMIAKTLDLPEEERKLLERS